MVLTINRARARISVARSSWFRRATTDDLLHNSRAVGNSSICMWGLLFGRTPSGDVLPLEKNIHNSTCTHQVRYGPEYARRRRRRSDTAQIGPPRRDHECAAVRQGENQVQCSLAMHSAEDRQRLPLQRVLLTRNNHALHRVLDVGSLSYSSSTPSTTTGSWTS